MRVLSRLFSRGFKHKNTMGLSTVVGEFKTNEDLRVETMSGDSKGILVVGLNRHEGKNSFSKSFTKSLENVFEMVHNDDALRVVIIRSFVPRVFCGGADLKERLTMSDQETLAFVKRLGKLMSKIESSPIPVIAAINGAALGGGLEMALACDIRTATRFSKIGLVETKLAIIPGAGGTQRLSRLVGPAQAKELIFTSRVLSGEEAFARGIVNRCVASSGDEDGAFQEAVKIARDILPNGAIAIRMAKLAIDNGLQMDQQTGLTVENLCYSQVIPTKDRLEGLRAFAEKRSPNYIGK